MPPENVSQKSCGTLIKREELFKSRVKTTILPARELVTITGFQRFVEPAVLPIITGRSGRTQGARIVSPPARKDVKRSKGFISRGLERQTKTPRSGVLILYLQLPQPQPSSPPWSLQLPQQPPFFPSVIVLKLNNINKK